MRIVRDYPYPPALVWRALTDPELVPLWTATGAGARPEGLRTEVGTAFRYVARPRPGWSGVVVCYVLEADAPWRLRYTWQDAGGGAITEVSYRLESHGEGTRFTYEHTGFTGLGGFLMERLLGRVRRRMLTDGLPAVLATIDHSGHPRSL
jgi:uncharacterized protein YndB with AHSA1/START domain